MEVSLENLKSFLLRNLVLVKPLVLFGDCSNDMAACTIELGIFPFPIDCAILDCVLRVFDLAQSFLMELDNDPSQIYCACRCDLLLLYRFSCHVDILRSPQMSVRLFTLRRMSLGVLVCVSCDEIAEQDEVLTILSNHRKDHVMDATCDPEAFICLVLVLDVVERLNLLILDVFQAAVDVHVDKVPGLAVDDPTTVDD